MSRRTIATAKFGWFWSNHDVEQTPPNAVRSSAPPNFDTPLSHQALGRNAEEGRARRGVYGRGVGVSNDVHARADAGAGGGGGGGGGGGNDAGAVSSPMARRGSAMVMAPADAVEQTTPERQATRSGLVSRQMHGVPQSPFLLYAELELSPITPAGGSSALHAARSLGPLYPKSPPPSSVMKSGANGSSVDRIGASGGGSGSRHISHPYQQPALVLSSANLHTPGAVLNNNKDRAEGSTGQKNAFSFRSLQPIVDGHAQLRVEQQPLFDPSPSGGGGSGSPSEKGIGHFAGARGDGKSSAYGQGPTRRRLSSTFNEAFQPKSGGKSSRGGMRDAKAGVSRDAKAGRGGASGATKTASMRGASDSARASTSERNLLFGQTVHVNLQTGTPVPLTPLNDDGCDPDDVLAYNGVGDKAATVTPHNRITATSSCGSKDSRKRKGGSGCKRCNCKKSRCLKLYCECFAAGIFCDNCNCQNCMNTPQNAELVASTRKQIEGRNPHAFAPKIVQEVDGTTVTPMPPSLDGKNFVFSLAASLRHKKGCNCKKSHCLKKYCECFQAGVKCTDLCKCVNCKNGKCGDDDCNGDDNEPQKQRETTTAPPPPPPAVVGLDAKATAGAGMALKHKTVAQVSSSSKKSPGPRHELTPVTPHPGSVGASVAAPAMKRNAVPGKAGALVSALTHEGHGDGVAAGAKHEAEAQLTKENLTMDRADDELLMPPMLNFVASAAHK